MLWCKGFCRWDLIDYTAGALNCDEELRTSNTNKHAVRNVTRIDGLFEIRN